jgi:hypothetical protein
MSTGLIDPRPPIKLRRQTMPTEVCEACGRKFYHHPDNANRFCSRECHRSVPPTHSKAFVALLATRWDAGETVSRMALWATEHLGRPVTRNTVLSLAHSNGFAPRPSPIKRAALGSAA